MFNHIQTGRRWLDRGGRTKLVGSDRPCWRCPSLRVVEGVWERSRTFLAYRERRPYVEPCCRTNPVRWDRLHGRWAGCRRIRCCSRQPSKLAVHQNRPILRSRWCDSVAIFADLWVRRMCLRLFDQWWHPIPPATWPYPSYCKQSPNAVHSLLN